MSVLVNVNSCRIVVAVKSLEYWFVSTQTLSILNLNVCVHAVHFTNAFIIKVLLARLDHVRVVTVCCTSLCVAAQNTILSAVVVQSGATSVFAVTVAQVYDRGDWSNAFGLLIYWVLYWRFSGI